jgi:hypothetical protein
MKWKVCNIRVQLLGACVDETAGGGVWLSMRHLPRAIEMRKFIGTLKRRSPQRKKDDEGDCRKQEDPVNPRG